MKGEKPAYLEEFLKEHGDEPIKKIAVVRTPITKGFIWALDILSSGSFSETAKKLGYKHVYHNFLMVETSGGKYVLESTHDVIARPFTDKDNVPEGNSADIPLNGKSLTINKLFDNIKRERNYEFWRYDPKRNNCQRFCLEVITDSGLYPNDKLDDKAEGIIKPQNGDALIDSLGGNSEVPGLLTDMRRWVKDIFGFGVLPDDADE